MYQFNCWTGYQHFSQSLNRHPIFIIIETFSKQTRIINYTMLKGSSGKITMFVLVVLPPCTVILVHFGHSPFSVPMQAITSPGWNWFHFVISNLCLILNTACKYSHRSSSFSRSLPSLRGAYTGHQRT